MKKLSFPAFLVLLVLIFTMLPGCQMSRMPISANEFKTRAEAAGYFVQDALDQFPEGAAETYLIAFVGGDAIEYQIEFAVTSTTEQAVSAYRQNRSDFEAQKGSFSSDTSVSVGNYSYYKLTSNGKYSVISRIENTFIYVNAPAEHKDAIVEFLNSIGY